MADSGNLKQDLSKKDENNSVFIMHLLSKEKLSTPPKEKMLDVLQKHLGDVLCFNYDEKSASFAANDYRVEVKEGNLPVLLLVMDSMPLDNFEIDVLARSQMWDCPESTRILDECKYHVVAVDMMVALLPC